MDWSLKQLWPAQAVPMTHAVEPVKPAIGTGSLQHDALDAHGGAGSESELSQQVRAVRQRTLLRTGAKLNAAMNDRGELGSLAMLDESGTVVSWYGRDNDDDALSDTAVGRNVAQFYTPQDIDLGLPFVDLRNAKLRVTSTHAGWRRRLDGEEFSAITIIVPIVHRNGRLQGFSHVVRRSSGPWENVDAAQTNPDVSDVNFAAMRSNPISIREPNSV